MICFADAARNCVHLLCAQEQQTLRSYDSSLTDHLITFASMVSSREVFKNGISFVPPVPTNS